MFNLKIIIHAIKAIASRVIVVYLCIILLYNICVDFNKVKAKTLNYLKPGSFLYLQNFISDRNQLNKDVLAEYTYYYDQVTHYLPNRVDAQFMAGFCNYYLGNQHRAIHAHKKAIKANPEFFLFYYNLAIIYFNNEQYKKAADVLIQGVNSNPKYALNFISSSKVYYDLMSGSDDIKNVVVSGVKNGFSQYYELLILSFYHKKDFEKMLFWGKYATTLNLRESDKFHFYTGVAYFEMKDYNKAIFFLRNCINMNQNHVDALYYLGLALQSIDQGHLAKDLIQKSLALKKTYVDSPLTKTKFELKIF